MKIEICNILGSSVSARVLLLALAVSALVLASSPNSYAQATTDFYQLSAFDNNINASNADQWVRIINPGVSGETVCADLYVFDDQQDLIECCACPISANGLLTLSLVRDLTANSILPTRQDRGVLKIVSSSSCDPKAPVPTPNLRAWIAHYETMSKGNYNAYSDIRFDRSDLSSAEENFLGQACAFVQYLGSGRGVCRCPATP